MRPRYIMIASLTTGFWTFLAIWYLSPTWSYFLSVKSHCKVEMWAPPKVFTPCPAPLFGNLPYWVFSPSGPTQIYIQSLTLAKFCVVSWLNTKKIKPQSHWLFYSPYCDNCQILFFDSILLKCIIILLLAVGRNGSGKSNFFYGKLAMQHNIILRIWD